MPKCVVPGCTSGYDTNPEKNHFFTVPKNEEAVVLWGKAIKRRDVKPRQAVCQNHFRPEEIVWKRPLLGADGVVLGVSHYKVPRLAKGTVPSIFPWAEVTEPPKIIPETRIDISPKDQQDVLTQPLDTPKNIPETRIDISPKEQQDVLTQSVKRQKTIERNVNPPLDPLQPQNNDTPDHQDNVTQAVDTAADKKTLTSVTSKFEQLLKAGINRPSGWLMQKIVKVASPACNSTRMIVLCTHNCTNVNGMYEPYILKSVTVKDNLSISVAAIGQHVDMRKFNFPRSITDTAELEGLVRQLHAMNVCKGSMGYSVDARMNTENCNEVHKDITGMWRHNKCPLFLTNATICKYCRNIKKTLAMKYRRWSTEKIKEERCNPPNSPTNREKMIRLRESLCAPKASVVQDEKKYMNLKAELKMSQMRIAQCTNLEKELESGNISEKQAQALQEIIDAAKQKNSKGRNFSEEWILLCMLLYLRSSSSYDFLRKNDVLRLPCPRTIRRYLSKMNSTFGFDPQLFEIFKLALSKKDESQRHGVLLLNEMGMRESAKVDTENRTYKGLVDFRNDKLRWMDLSKKVNKGLVFVCQALNDTYTQPIGVFASDGPVKGEMLARLIMEAIILLEGIGAKIHGVVSNTASPNQKFWVEVGASGVKGKLRNYFDHPLDVDRKVFIFSDTPHLIKTIRNRLYDNKDIGLRMSSKDPLITWGHIKTLQEKDRELSGHGQQLVCPKLTSDHVNLNNTLKTRLRLAAQVFSNSVAAGLRFYEKCVPELQGCEETASFCKWMNDIFDALNRKHPVEGVQVGDADFKILEESLKTLDAWEEQVEMKKLPNEQFLPKQTAEGLRVTLKSTVDLIRYLTENCDFKYVMTSRINLDA